MCLPDFVKFKQIEKDTALTGYKIWRNVKKEDNLTLLSEYMTYEWKEIEGPHEVLEENSGIYSYNNYNYYNNYYYNYHYYISGIIKQYGKVAIHKTGYRSEFAIIDTIFSIRESDAKGSKEFLDWIKKFNNKIEKIAQIYKCKTISYQNFLDENKEE